MKRRTIRRRRPPTMRLTKSATRLFRLVVLRQWTAAHTSARVVFEEVAALAYEQRKASQRRRTRRK